MPSALAFLMNVENEKDAGVKVEHVNCSDTFNTSQVFV